jgi:hypothetical protein
VTEFIAIEDITPGNSYACKFKVKTMLDDLGRPAPNLSDRPLAGVKEYEGIGILMQRDMDQRLVKLQDEKSQKEFVVSFDDIWDVDDIEWNDPLVNEE